MGMFARQGMAFATIRLKVAAVDLRAQLFILVWQPVPLDPRHRMAPLLSLAGRIPARACGAIGAEAPLQPFRQAPRGGWRRTARRHCAIYRLSAASHNMVQL